MKKKSKFIVPLVFGLVTAFGISQGMVHAADAPKQSSQNQMKMIENPNDDLKLSPEQGKKLYQEKEEKTNLEHKIEEQNFIENRHNSMKLSFHDIIAMASILLFMTVLFSVIFFGIGGI